MLMDVLIFDSRNSVIDLLELLTILDCLVSLSFFKFAECLLYKSLFFWIFIFLNEPSEFTWC